MKNLNECNWCQGEAKHRIIVDWDRSYVIVCDSCLGKYGEYAISCCQGSKSQAEKIAQELAQRKMAERVIPIIHSQPWLRLPYKDKA